MDKFALATTALLAFLVPVGAYFFILSAINRRNRPLVVSGVWDAVGLLFAGSGFFLVTVPMLLSEFYANTLATPSADPFEVIWMRHWMLSLAYFLFLISLSALMLLWRVHKTSIYNVNPSLVNVLLGEALAKLGFSATSVGDALILTAAKLTSSPEETGIQAGVAPAGPAPQGELQIEAFPAMCHVSLHWDNYTPQTRSAVESELSKALILAAPDVNPAAGWLLSISGMIFGALFTVLVLGILLILFPR